MPVGCATYWLITPVSRSRIYELATVSVFIYVKQGIAHILLPSSKAYNDF